MIINNTKIDGPIVAQLLWGARFRLMVWGALAAVLGIVVAYSIPKEYVTEIQIALEDDNNSASSSLGGLAAMAGINISASGSGVNALSSEAYPDIIRSSPFLYEFADVKVKHEDREITFYQYLTAEQKGPWWGSVFQLPSKFLELFNSDKLQQNGDNNSTKINLFNPKPSQRLFAIGFNSRIQIQIDPKKKIAKIAIQMQDPVIAAVIADTLITKLQKYVTNYKTSKTREDLSVKSQILADVQLKYYIADSIYAQYKDRNQNITSQSAMLKINRIENEKNLAFSVYQQLASQVELDKVKLQEQSSIATIIEPPVVAIAPKSPNKKMIFIAFTFLGIMVGSSFVVIRTIFPKKN